ncbi:MAG: hydantoinase/oxoprolinase family protein [Rhizobiales bacterium]|nr:hydantoinase/oxoprolinase family protein [Hyphomicrobiales bacterium]
MAHWSVGIDTGGTFTDLAAVDHASGETFVAKVPSTPAKPADAILEALNFFSASNQVPLAQLSLLAHGTTVATNALLEEKGVKAGLLITAGFRAVYPARAGTRPRGGDLIDPRYRKAAPLIPLALTCEIPERIGFDGRVLRPLDRDAVRAAAQRLKREGCQAIAICFLFSFLSDDHEREAAEIIRSECPDIRVSRSSEVLPVIREFPRLSTVALDAYVGPVVSAYFNELGERVSVKGVNLDRAFIMQSNGGLMRLNIASAYPNETLLSGPAAGIGFATALAQQIGEKDVVTFDMGGTSTDISLVRGGQAATVNRGIIAGQEIGTSMIEIRTIGAGGGAIAHIGDDGLLKVGPQSAGAIPGPACYARGGTEPTVTDANVLLGYIDAERFLGGQLKGDRGLAETALSKLGDALGLDPLEAAIGVRRVINSRMGSALRLNVTEKGCDPRDFALLAFGGCGPMHAVEIAENLGLRRVIVPTNPGVSCAMGLLLSDVKHVYPRSMPHRFVDASASALNSAFQTLEQKAKEDATREGFGADTPQLIRQLDVRYTHQGYQLIIDAPPIFADDDLLRLRRAFDALHERIYGTCAPNEDAEIVSIRLVSVVKMPRLPLRSRGLAEATTRAEPRASRQAYFPSAGAFFDAPIYARDALGAGTRLAGPLIVEQLDSTTVVGPGRQLHVDAVGNLVIDTGTTQDTAP